ncbi:MAG: Na+/H+ antiporter [Chloroflexi bacterium]|nr:Na+/H+ antiporter [Chloroflexota bacterium]
MEQFLTTETLIIELLLVVSLVATAVRRLRVPYTVALVIVGLLITFQQPLQINLTPELILSLFVPPLIFEAAFHINLDELRENFSPIIVLAVAGVLLSTFVVGIIVAAGVHLPLPTALVFGALISATDPVAVIALFRSLGAPKQLTLLLEGESLLNDGTAIVIFSILLSLAIGPLAASSDTAAQVAGSSTEAAGGLNVVTTIVEFFRVSLGGAGIGILLGWIISLLIARIDDYLIETTLTTVLAFGAYLLAERLHVSGVLAVVGAGIVSGNFGHRGMSPTTRIVLFNFWEYLAFIANSLIFLLIGLAVNVPQIAANIGPIAIAVIAVIAGRALTVYLLTWITNHFNRTQIPVSYRHVLFWGGLRGAIGLALALALPFELPNRELLIIMAYGVVLFTLLGQGTTMQMLLARLNLLKDQSTIDLEYHRRHARLIAARAAQSRLQQLHHNGILYPATWQKIAPVLENQVKEFLEAQNQLLQKAPELQAESLEYARKEGLRAQRAALADLLRNGVVSDKVYEELITEVDAKIHESETRLDNFEQLETGTKHTTT